MTDIQDLEEIPYLFEKAEWMKEAACKGMNVNLFFAERGDHLTFESAKLICQECPVRLSCLEFAVRIGERNGIWGGTSDRLRRSMRRLYLDGVPFDKILEKIPLK